MKKLMLDFTSPCEGYILAFEDDGKVAYAYLKKDGRIIAHVWLYNRCEAPENAEWRDKANIPFANCRGYISEEARMTSKVEVSDVLIDWEVDDLGPVAYVYIFENLYGVLSVGSKIGCARYAIKDSPLAKVMEIV